MEESRKTNIIIGLLLAIFAVLIFAVLILAQVNFTHRSDFTAVAMSKDGVKMNVSYTVKFNAPLIIPSKIRKEAEWKMKILFSVIVVIIKLLLLLLFLLCRTVD